MKYFDWMRTEDTKTGLLFLKENNYENYKIIMNRSQDLPGNSSGQIS